MPSLQQVSIHTLRKEQGRGTCLTCHRLVRFWLELVSPGVHLTCREGKETAEEGRGKGLGKKGKTEGARGPKGREEVMRKKSKMTHFDISHPSLVLTELHSEPLTSDLFLDSTILGVIWTSAIL